MVLSRREEEIEEEEEDPFFLNLHIRVATGHRKEFTLRVEATATVDQFKQQIRQYLHIDDDQNLRLIFNGKLLGPDSCTVESTELKNNSYVHAVISPKPIHHSSASSEGNASLTQRPSDVVLDHRGLNSLLRGVEGDARQRLSREEVDALRAYFSPAIRAYAERHLTRGQEESEEDFTLRAETEWMAAQPPHSEFRFNLNIAATQALFRAAAGGGTGALVFFQFNDAANSRNIGDLEDGGIADRSQQLGTMRDFFFGVSLGYLFGFMMIFCVWDANVTYRQKLGILTGMMLQMVVSMVVRGGVFSVDRSAKHGDTSSNDSGNLRGSSSLTPGSGPL